MIDNDVGRDAGAGTNIEAERDAKVDAGRTTSKQHKHFLKVTAG